MRWVGCWCCAGVVECLAVSCFMPDLFGLGIGGIGAWRLVDPAHLGEAKVSMSGEVGLPR